MLQVLVALLRSHGEHVGREAKALALAGALLAGFGAVASVYSVILATYLLALWLGPVAALAAILGAALLGCLVAALLLRRATRRLRQVHREHVEQERLAVKAATAEVVAAGRLSASLAAVSASVAALLVILIRRLGGEPPANGAGPAGGPPPQA